MVIQRFLSIVVHQNYLLFKARSDTCRIGKMPDIKNKGKGYRKYINELGWRNFT